MDSDPDNITIKNSAKYPERFFFKHNTIGVDIIRFNKWFKKKIGKNIFTYENTIVEHPGDTKVELVLKFSIVGFENAKVDHANPDVRGEIESELLKFMNDYDIKSIIAELMRV